MMMMVVMMVMMDDDDSDNDDDDDDDDYNTLDSMTVVGDLLEVHLRHTRLREERLCGATGSQEGDGGCLRCGAEADG